MPGALVPRCPLCCDGVPHLPFALVFCSLDGGTEVSAFLGVSRFPFAIWAVSLVEFFESPRLGFLGARHGRAPRSLFVSLGGVILLCLCGLGDVAPDGLVLWRSVSRALVFVPLHGCPHCISDGPVPLGLAGVAPNLNGQWPVHFPTTSKTWDCVCICCHLTNESSLKVSHVCVCLSFVFSRFSPCFLALSSFQFRSMSFILSALASY